MQGGCEDPTSPGDIGKAPTGCTVEERCTCLTQNQLKKRKMWLLGQNWKAMLCCVELTVQS